MRQSEAVQAMMSVLRDALLLGAVRMNRLLKSTGVKPDHTVVKARLILAYAERHKLGVFVETGTYLGDMLAAVQSAFTRCYSIELSERLYRWAAQRFKNDRNVLILHGDSGVVLPSLVSQIAEPALFWLDAHPSGGITAGQKSPIRQEIAAILNRVQPDAILMDDAASFTGSDGYPSIEELIPLVKMTGRECCVDQGIVCVPPKFSAPILSIYGKNSSDQPLGPSERVSSPVPRGLL